MTSPLIPATSSGPAATSLETLRSPTPEGHPVSGPPPIPRVGPHRLAELRRLFPGLEDGWIRLDGPGGSQTPTRVTEAMVRYLQQDNANLGGVFAHSVATGDVVAQARIRLAAFLNADQAGIGFGLNATALNAHLAGQAARGLQPGREIVITVLDHDANTEPWLRAATDNGLTVRTVGVGPDTRLDMTALAEAINERTAIVAFPWAGNATGTRVDVAAVTELAHKAGALAWADATHYLPHGPVDVGGTGVDVLVGSAYKFFGPHLGIFYASPRIAAGWQPAEAGTLPFESLAGLTAALDYLADVGWEFIQGTEQALGQQFLDGLPGGWHLHGLTTMRDRTATFAVTLPGHHPLDLAQDLARLRIAAWAGDFHSPAIMNALRLPEGTLRIGLLHYNTPDEIDRTLQALTVIAADRA